MATENIKTGHICQGGQTLGTPVLNDTDLGENV